VSVFYVPHVEFDAEFQRRFGDHTWQLPVLRVYNQGVYSKGTHLPVPYALVVDEWVMKEDHLYPKLMTKYRDKFWHSQARRGGEQVLRFVEEDHHWSRSDFSAHQAGYVFRTWILTVKQ
jgi:hypothetical protein